MYIYIYKYTIRGNVHERLTGDDQHNCMAASTHRVQAADSVETGGAVHTREHDEPVRTKESITGCANDGARVCKHRRGDVNQVRRKFSQWSREHRGEHAAKNTRAIMAATRGRARERAFARERVREHEQHALAQDVIRQPTLETHWFSPVLSRRKQPRLARREGCLRVATQQKIHMSRRAVQENCKRAHLPGVHVGDHVEELDTPWLHARVASAC